MVNNSACITSDCEKNEFVIYDKAISWIVTLAMGALTVVPMIVSLILIFHRNIDDILSAHLYIVKDILFPCVCLLVIATYLIPILVGKIKIKDFFRFLKKNPVFIIFLLLVMWFFISQIINGPKLLWMEYYHEWLGETFYMEVAYILIILFGATQIREKSQKNLLVRIHMISSIFVALSGQILWYSNLKSESNDFWVVKGSIFPQFNNYGYYLTITVALSGAMFIHEKDKIWKYLAMVTYIINSLAMSLNDTLGAWVGAASAILFIIITKWIVDKKFDWRTLILIPVFSVCIFIPAHKLGTFEQNFVSLGVDIGKVVEGDNIDGIGTGRGIIWKASMEIIDENKLFGIGFEGVLYRLYVGAPYNIRPHNEFMQYALFHGIPAAIIYFAGCLGIFIRALRKKRYLDSMTLVCLTAAFAYLVSSFFGLTLFSTAYFLFVFLGMGYVRAPVELAEPEKR